MTTATVTYPADVTAQIRSALAKYGWNRRQVSVKILGFYSDGSTIGIKIKAPGVSCSRVLSVVERIITESKCLCNASVEYPPEFGAS